MFNAETTLTSDWLDFYLSQKDLHYFKQLEENLSTKKDICPTIDKVFRAFSLTYFNQVKVVVVAQDPYHGYNQANGLAFAVNSGNQIPPSLQNIFKELATDFKKLPSKEVLKGSLISWAQQGVLLLNTTLTVDRGSPMSHKGLGWETFTDNVILELNKKESPIVYILWGKHAQSKIPLIAEHHLILKSAHPSPLSASKGFFGSKPFSKANYLLESTKQLPIDWLN